MHALQPSFYCFIKAHSLPYGNRRLLRLDAGTGLACLPVIVLANEQRLQLFHKYWPQHRFIVRGLAGPDAATEIFLL